MNLASTEDSMNFWKFVEKWNRKRLHESTICTKRLKTHEHESGKKYRQKRAAFKYLLLHTKTKLWYHTLQPIGCSQNNVVVFFFHMSLGFRWTTSMMMMMRKTVFYQTQLPYRLTHDKHGIRFRYKAKIKAVNISLNYPPFNQHWGKSVGNTHIYSLPAPAFISHTCIRGYFF